MAIETHILAIIEGKKTAPLTKLLLSAMSQCYRAGVALRHLAYDRFLSTTKLPLSVISVGNIVAGGTGKTPVVHYLAEALGQEGVAILSRGYRRKSNQMLVVDGTMSPEICGDEPYLLAQKLPQAQVIVGGDRVLSGQLAQKLGAKLLILDDGMQHRQLHRDVEIGVLHASDLFGKGHYLPRGLLRDSPKRLAKADLLIVNGVKDPSDLSKIEPLIRNYSQAPIALMETRVKNSTALASKKVGAFCAIAAPKRFANTLKTLGCDIVLQREKPDHIPFTKQELELLANQAQDKGAECLVCTEKDAVKLPQALALSLPVIPVQIALVPTLGKEHIQTIIQEVHS